MDPLRRPLVRLAWILTAAALLLPARAHTQPALVCNARLDLINAAGPACGVVGDIFRKRISIGAGTITGGTLLRVNRLRFSLDCNSVPSPFCPDEGAIIRYVGDSSISTADCLDGNADPVFWASNLAPGSVLPNEVEFTPSSPVVLPADSIPDCQIEFDVEVAQAPGLDASPYQVQQVAHLSSLQEDAACDNGLPASVAAGGIIPLCQDCDVELDKIITVTVPKDLEDTCDEDQGFCRNAPASPCTGDGDCRILDTATGWQDEAASVEFRVRNDGALELVACELTDDQLGSIATGFSVPVGGFVDFEASVVCSEAVAVNTATVQCECAPIGAALPAEDTDSAELACQSAALEVVKECVDSDGDGVDDGAAIEVLNTGDADLVNCQVEDVLDRDAPPPPDTCPGDGIEIETVPVSPAVLDLPAGTSQPVGGSFAPSAGFACNTAEVCCNIDDAEGGVVIDPATGQPKVVCDLAEAACVGLPEDGITIDIKPGSCPNSYNRSSRGVLPVAVVGTPEFAVSRIDPGSVEICRRDENDVLVGCIAPHEGPPGPRTVIEDVATPFPGEVCDCHEENGDGIPDLSLKFKTVDLVAALQLDELPAGDLVPLTVRGSIDGMAFEASDCVRLVPPGTPPNMMRVKSNAGEAWVTVAPLDEQLDGGGFAEFERTYPASTEAELVAEPTQNGRAFRGWRADDGRLVPGETFRLIVDGHIQTMEAVYETPSRRCGLGYELALLLAPLLWLRARRRRPTP